MAKPKRCKVSTCPYFERPEVGYSGTFNTDVVIVGESPGRTEIEVGKPFVGASGLVLTALLHSIDKTRDEVLIANSCRCMIAKDTDPIKDMNLALKTCRPYLYAAIKKAKPKVIVTLGAFALQQVLGKKAILKNRGQFFWSEEFNCQVFVTVHPAYVLRGAGPKFWEKPAHQRSMKENLLFMDFVQVQKFLETGVAGDLEATAEKYQKGSMTSLDALLDIDKPMEMLVHRRAGEAKAPRKVVAVDFETTGLNMFDPAVKVLSIALCSEPGNPIVFFADKTTGTFPKKVLDVLSDPKVTKVVASRPFDEVVAKVKLKTPMQGTIHDVLVMAHLIDENYTKYSLEEVANIYTPLKGIKGLAQGMRDQLQNLDKGQLLKYNAVDADATIRVYRALKQLMGKDEALTNYYVNFILPILDMFAETFHHGGTLDLVQMKKDEKKLTRLVKTLSAESLAMIPPEIIEKHTKRHKKTQVVLKRPTLRQLPMLIDFIFMDPKGLRCKPNPKYVTKKNRKPQCTEDHLKQFDYPFLVNLVRIKKAEKVLGTYLKKFWKSIKDEQGRIYPSTSLNSTVTGRTVMRDPTIQTIPQRGEFAPYAKRAFIAPPGWLLGARDLGQSEIRIMGWLAKDPNILKALREGVDIHTMTAAIVNRVKVSEVTKDMRQKAKGVNFGFLYGMQAKSFQQFAKDEYGLNFTLDECHEVRRLFFAAPNGYYRLPQYHTEQEHLALRQGYIRSILGRVRRLPGAFSTDIYERGNAARQAINMPIQSFSSDLGLIGMMLFYRKLKEKGYLHRIQPLWFIHDAVMFQCEAKLMPIAMKLLKKCMEEESVKYVLAKFGVKIGYPVTSDGKCGKSWATLAEWDDEKGKVKDK